MSFAIGETIHQRYTIRRLISKQGGFGHTYLAEDAETRRMVVIKASKTARVAKTVFRYALLEGLGGLRHPFFIPPQRDEAAWVYNRATRGLSPTRTRL